MRELLADLLVLGLHNDALRVMRTQWPLLHGVRRKRTYQTQLTTPLAPLTDADFAEGPGAVANVLAHVELAEMLRTRKNLPAAAGYYAKAQDLIRGLPAKTVDGNPEIVKARGTIDSGLRYQWGCTHWISDEAQKRAVARSAEGNLNRLWRAVIDADIDEALKATGGTDREKQVLTHAIAYARTRHVTDFSAKAISVQIMDLEKGFAVVNFDQKWGYETAKARQGRETERIIRKGDFWVVDISRWPLDDDDD